MATAIVVYVDDKFDAPVEHVYVHDGLGHSGYTDSTGKAFIYCNPGSFTVYISRYGMVPRSQYISVALDEWKDVFFRTSTSYEMHASVEGIVHDDAGNPVGDILVWSMGVLSSTKYWGCITQSTGYYRLPINQAGSYNIVCGTNNHETVLHSLYVQAAAAPTSTTTKNFTGAYKSIRRGLDDPIIGVSCKSIVLLDNYVDGYYYPADASTNNVKAKVRKWTGSDINTYAADTAWTKVRDGSGGTQYD